MKKLLSLIITMSLVLSLLFTLTSCTGLNNNTDNEGTNELIALPKDATLTVGTKTFVNNTKATETDVYLTYTQTVIYRLNMSYYSQNAPEGYFPVSEGSYAYYYWQKQTITQEQLMGKQVIVTDTTYEYLPYSGGESIMVKTNIKQSHMFDFEGGFIEKPIEYQIDLNGYFTSVEQATASHPDLMAAANTGNIADKYYVDTVIPQTQTSSTSTFDNTYYYITYEK